MIPKVFPALLIWLRYGSLAPALSQLVRTPGVLSLKTWLKGIPRWLLPKRPSGIPLLPESPSSGWHPCGPHIFQEPRINLDSVWLLQPSLCPSPLFSSHHSLGQALLQPHTGTLAFWSYFWNVGWHTRVNTTRISRQAIKSAASQSKQ